MKGPTSLLAVFVGLAVLTAVAGASGAQELARRARGTDEFRIAYWPVDADQAEVAAAAADVAIERLKYSLDVELTQRIEIDLCHTQKEFDEHTGEKNALWIQGRAFPRYYRVVVKALGPRRIGKLIAHELLHVRLQRKLDETGAPAPRWLHEGLAKYVTGDLPRADRQLLSRATRRDELLGINELEAAFAGSPAQISLAYAQGYTLVEYLSALGGKTGLSEFLEELGQVRDVDRALVRTYQKPVSQLEEDWLSQIRHTYIGVRRPDVLGDWLWAGIAGLFLVALAARLRRARAIRERMQEEEDERLRLPPGVETTDQTEVEEAH